MQTSKSFGIHFTLRTDKSKDGKFPIYACITVNRQRAYISIKESLHPSRWDAKKGSVKGTGAEMKAVSNYMEEVRYALREHYKQLEVRSQPITAAKIKSLYLGEVEEPEKQEAEPEAEIHMLGKLCAYHNEVESSKIRASTMKHYHVTQRYLVRFLKFKFGQDDIPLHELNHKFLLDFEVFLRQYRHTDHLKCIQHNGVMKHIVRFKKMVNMAVDLNWLDKDPFGNFKVRVHKVKRTQLNLDELAVLEKYKFAVERLAVVRDMFVFCCYTGLAYVDLSNLSPADIEEDGGDLWISTQRWKTSVPVDIPILPPALVIMDRYKNYIRTTENDRVFPVITNQKMNCYLKEIAELCGIKKNMTSHLARHTFATTIALENKMPIETVSKLLGHTKITTTLIYAKVLREKVRADMKELKEKLNNE